MRVLGCGRIFLLIFLGACVGAHDFLWRADFVRRDVVVGPYVIATWGRITKPDAPLRIYIEGDGNSFDGRGRPTSDPTPRGDMLRAMAARDVNPNVVYVARPCQFVMTDACGPLHWTSGRFAQELVDVMASAVRTVADGRPVVIIGYSGGAMMSGLIILQNPDIDVRQWITIAGVLNHADWTEYFGDSALTDSINMDELPRVPQVHYIAENDKIVPQKLSRRWGGVGDVIVVPGTRHGDFGQWVPK